MISSIPPTPTSPAAEGPLARQVHGLSPEVLSRVVEFAPGLLAVIRRQGFEILFLNDEGRRWVVPGARPAGSPLTLRDIVAMPSWDRVASEAIPQVSVLGRWAGVCDLCDVHGSPVTVRAVLTSHESAPDRGGAVLVLQAIRVDGRREWEDASTGDRELLHALMESSPDSIYFKDLHSRFVRVSRSMARKDGRADPKELIGLTDFDRFSGNHAQKAYETEQTIIRTGEPVLNIEEHQTWPDGREQWVQTSKMPLRDHQGQVVGTFGVSRDITARKRAEAERLDLESQLQLARRLESIGGLAAGIAHEINTPSQFIADNTRFLIGSFTQVMDLVGAYRSLLREVMETAGAPESLGRRVADAEAKAELEYLGAEVPQTLQQNLDGLERIARIVRSLKEFSHPSNMNRTIVDLNHSVETAVTVSRHEWKYVADLTTELDPGMPGVSCIPDQINQVLLNLIVNAAHAVGTAKAGREKGAIVVRTRREKNWAVLEVGDNGTGIAPEHRHRVFEPFFTTKEVGKGTGQGLTLVHSIVVKNHSGRIDFVTEMGQGTTFRVFIPMPDGPPSAQPSVGA